jgi:hypothetical protein
VGVRHAQDRARLGSGEGAQRDAVGQVRVEPAQPALVEPLRGEQQVDAERAAQPPDGDQEVDQFGPLGEELGELVDDHEQRRQRRHLVGGGAPRRGVLRRAGQVARRPEQLLPPGDLARERVRHAVDEVQLVRQVRDDRGHVRQATEAEEGGAALEVDEHEVQLGRRVRGHQAQDECPQQLALARTRGAHAEAVRPAAALCGLLEIQRHGYSGLVEADRHVQPVRGVPAAPAQGVDLRRADRRPARCSPAQTEQLGQAGRGGRTGCGTGPGGPVAGEAAGQGRGLRHGECVRPADGVQRSRVVRPGQVDRPHDEAHDGRRRSPAGRRTDAQHRRSGHGGPRAGPCRFVDDHEQVGVARCGARGPTRQLGLPPPPDVVGLRRHHPRRPGRVAVPRVTGVWQPLHPLPLRRQVRRCHHGQLRVGRAVPQHVLRHEGAGQCAGGLGSGARCGLEPDRTGAPQRQRDRQGGDDRVRTQEAA